MAQLVFVLMCGLAAWHPPGEQPFQYHHTTTHCKNPPRNYKDTIKYVVVHKSAKLSICILKKQKQLLELASEKAVRALVDYL